MDKWNVYAYLKRYEGQVNLTQVYNAFSNLDRTETLEGVEEFCLALQNLNHMPTSPMILIEMIERRRKLGA